MMLGPDGGDTQGGRIGAERQEGPRMGPTQLGPFLKVRGTEEFMVEQIVFWFCGVYSAVVISSFWLLAAER